MPQKVAGYFNIVGFAPGKRASLRRLDWQDDLPVSRGSSRGICPSLDETRRLLAADRFDFWPIGGCVRSMPRWPSSPSSVDQRGGGRRDVRDVDAGGAQQLRGRSRARQLGHAQVRRAELLISRGEQRGHDGRAETALGMVILGDDDPALGGLRGGAEARHDSG
jgi:hypothetical protein